MKKLQKDFISIFVQYMQTKRKLLILDRNGNLVLAHAHILALGIYVGPVSGQYFLYYALHACVVLFGFFLFFCINLLLC